MKERRRVRDLAASTGSCESWQAGVAERALYLRDLPVAPYKAAQLPRQLTARVLRPMHAGRVCPSVLHVLKAPRAPKGEHVNFLSDASQFHHSALQSS